MVVVARQRLSWYGGPAARRVPNRRRHRGLVVVVVVVVDHDGDGNQVAASPPLSTLPPKPAPSITIWRGVEGAAIYYEQKAWYCS